VREESGRAAQMGVTRRPGSEASIFGQLPHIGPIQRASDALAKTYLTGGVVVLRQLWPTRFAQGARRSRSCHSQGRSYLRQGTFEQLHRMARGENWSAHLRTQLVVESEVRVRGHGFNFPHLQPGISVVGHQLE
jgi:hypothetical protein